MNSNFLFRVLLTAIIVVPAGQLPARGAAQAAAQSDAALTVVEIKP